MPITANQFCLFCALAQLPSSVQAKDLVVNNVEIASEGESEL